MYYKRLEDESIVTGNKVNGPNFILDETTTNETYDGWKWFETSDAAYVYFANSQSEVSPEAQAAYDAAATVFESLSLGKRALWEPVRSAVATAILAGDMVTAYEILATTPAIYEGAEADRALFLNMFAP
jgi:hypothetical protein